MAELHLRQDSKRTFIASVVFAEIAAYDDEPIPPLDVVAE